MSVSLYLGDVFEEIKNIETDSVDLIVADLPYGQIKGQNQSAAKVGKIKKEANWDTVLDMDRIFLEFDRVLRQKGKLIMFSSTTFTNIVRSCETQGIKYGYNLVWVKNHVTNFLAANQKPLNKHEDITIFNKIYDTNRKNPLRQYAKKCFEHTGLSKKEFCNLIGRKTENFFTCYDALRFSKPSKALYETATKVHNLEEMPGYLTHDEIKEIYDNRYKNTFNRLTEKAETTVLEYKNVNKSVHPTQKPIELLEHLIKMYSNENDLVFDPTMGSGSTGVACVNTNRNFVGIERDVSYFETARERISEVFRC